MFPRRPTSFCIGSCVRRYVLGPPCAVGQRAAQAQEPHWRTCQTRTLCREKEDWAAEGPGQVKLTGITRTLATRPSLWWVMERIPFLGNCRSSAWSWFWPLSRPWRSAGTTVCGASSQGGKGWVWTQRLGTGVQHLRTGREGTDSVSPLTSLCVIP